jgi:hypothetical protein
MTRWYRRGFNDSTLLVPTLCVGTHVSTLCVAFCLGQDATQSVANMRSHALRGNEKNIDLFFPRRGLLP